MAMPFQSGATRMGQRRQHRGGTANGGRKKFSVFHVIGLLLAASVGLVIFVGRIATVQVSSQSETPSNPLLGVAAPRQRQPIADESSTSIQPPVHRQRQPDVSSTSIQPPIVKETTKLSQPQQHTSLPALPPVPAGDPANATVIAYAISLIKCGDFQSSVAGLNDAALVLRHSVHQNSVRNPASGSRYDYKMYAIVHTQAAECSHVLKDAGFEIVIKDTPVEKSEIEGEFLRKRISREWCCGEAEFIKLYAYTLPEPVVVHMDVDFVLHQPMDDVFDVMTLSDPSAVKAAQSKIPLERPNDPWPVRTDAFMTRDWPQVMPGRKAGYQAGFLVIRPDQKVFDEIVAVIRKGDYVEGFQPANGWGGAGYGGFVGAMAMQGLLAYYYDMLRPDTWMEVNQCRFNHMGMDVLYRSQPSFRPNHKKRGKCRNDLDYCEDCMHTETSKVYNIHYTQCRKPWNCVGIGSNDKNATKKSIPEDSVHLDHCMELLTIWHAHRQDLETKLLALTGDSLIDKGRGSDYKKEVFQGHCSGEGAEHYQVLSGQPATWKRLSELYEL